MVGTLPTSTGADMTKSTTTKPRRKKRVRLARPLDGRADLTIEQFSQRHQVCNQTVHNMINRGMLKTYKIGRSRRIPIEESDRVKAEAT